MCSQTASVPVVSDVTMAVQGGSEGAACPWPGLAHSDAGRKVESGRPCVDSVRLLQDSIRWDGIGRHDPMLLEGGSEELPLG